MGGRKCVSKELRALIFRTVAENPTWGAPRIHGELLQLGFDVSERSVWRWIRRTPKDPDPVKRWLTFLRNHREAIQQLREAWAYTQPHRFLLFDRDAKFGAEVVSAVRDMGSEPTRTAFGYSSGSDIVPKSLAEGSR